MGLIEIPYEINGSYITLSISKFTNTNIDYLNFTMSVRYGIHKRVELFSSINAYYQRNITNIDANFMEKHTGNFNTWNLGIFVQAKNEGKYPSLLISGSIDLMNMANFSNDTSKLQYII